MVRRMRQGDPVSVGRRRGFLLSVVLNGAATLQVVWLYLATVRSYLNLQQYENGAVHTPYQYRLLLMFPLRWAHGSAACVGVADLLSRLHAWFPRGVRPESVVEFPIDAVSVMVAGLVTRAIYRAASRTGLLTPLIYPLTLLMVFVTYGSSSMYRLRFIYDLPSLGFFAGGVFLLYFRKPWWQFALLFCVGTVNRETTLFLLVLLGMQYVQAAMLEGRAGRRGLWRRLMPDVVRTAVLLALWTGWHLWMVHRFRANATEAWGRQFVNLEAMVVPASWLQMLSCFAFCGPLLLLFWPCLRDRTLRLWLWVLPLWAVFMLHYGLFLESRIFGELIPLVACGVALGAEDALLGRLRLTTPDVCGKDMPGYFSHTL